MNNRKLYEEIKLYKVNYDREVLEDLINKFMPLIKKYSWKLYRDNIKNITLDDSIQELDIFFINLMKRVNLNKFNEDKQVVGYIKKSFENKELELSQKISKRNETPNLDFLEMQGYREEGFVEIEIEDLLIRTLSKKEYKVMKDIAFNGLTINEIANKEKITRQGVNLRKLSSRGKVRKYFN